MFRGSWCPYCNAQLRAFQRARDRLDELGVRVVAFSVDDERTTRALIDRHGLTFPVGHPADARALRAAVGAFVSGEPPYLESTGFVLDPQSRIVVSVYSSGAIGRLVPDDVVGLIRYLRDASRCSGARTSPLGGRSPAGGLAHAKALDLARAHRLKVEVHSGCHTNRSSAAMRSSRALASSSG